VGWNNEPLVASPGIVVGRKGTVGAINWSSTPFWAIDTTYYVIPNPGIDMRWCYWLLTLINLSKLDSSTGVPGLNRNDAYAERVLVPSEPEQRRIAEILDAADEAIRKTDDLIAKLKMMKRGLLHDLLTRGVDEDGRLREGNTEIGVKRPGTKEIPISEAAKLDPPVNFHRVGVYDLVSFVPMVDVTEDALWDKRRTRVFSEVRSGYTPFQEGDVLFAKITPCMENGKVCFAENLRNGVGFGSTEFYVLRANEGIEPRFLLYWLQTEAVRLRAQAFMIGSAGQQRVKPDFFASFTINVPTETEQRIIIEILQTHDARIRAEEAYRDKLKMIKKGLMHDLLTGRVRVKV